MKGLQTDSPVLTVAEAARYLKVSEPTIWRWIRTGRLPSFKVGRVRRIPLAALEALTDRERAAAVPAEARQFTLDDPLWALAGAGRSGVRGVSENKYKYLGRGGGPR